MKRILLVVAVALAGLSPGTVRGVSDQNITSNTWRFAVGDDLSRASTTFDDSSWRTIDVGKGWDAQGVARLGFGWYRTTVHPSAAVRSSPMTTLHLEPAPETAIWVYVDGSLKGTSASNPASIVLSPSDLPDHDVVIAVRALCGAHETFVGYNSCGLEGPVRLEPGSTGEKAMPLVLSTDRIGNLAEPGAAMSVYADVLNSTTSTRALALDITFEGGTPFHASVTLAGGQRHRFVAPFSSNRRGPVGVTARLSGNGKTLVTRTMTIGVADAPAAPDPRFGLNTLESDRIAPMLGTEGFGDPALAARAGASWLRVHLMPWKDVESERGRRDWDVMDAVHHAASGAGLDVLWNVLGVPYWALGYPVANLVSGLQSDLWCPPKTPFYGDFAQFHANAASRYPGDGWEIGNEPELPTNNYCWRQPEFRFDDATGYAKLLAETSAAIHAVDPAARVLTAALETVPIPFLGEPAFAAAVMDDDAFDVFNVHIYADESTIEASDGYRTAAEAKEMLARRGLHHEVWGTEYGGAGGGDLNRQRLAATRLALQLLAGGADRVAFFYTVEYQGEPLPGVTLFDQTGGPRPALFSYLTMTRMLAGLPLEGVVSMGGVPALRFSDGIRSVTAVWDEQGRTITIPPGADVFDDWGNPIAHGAAIKLGAAPTWLVQV